MGGKYVYYHCPKCGLRFTEDAVEKAVQEKISGLAMTPKAMNTIEEVVHELMRRDFGPVKKKKERAARQVAVLAEKLDQLIELRITDGISRDRYDAKKDDIENKLIVARMRYADFDAEKVNLVAEFERARQFLMNPGGFWRTATSHERQLTFPLFFNGPIALAWENKKVGTIRVESSNFLVWYTRRDSNARPPV